MRRDSVHSIAIQFALCCAACIEMPPQAGYSASRGPLELHVSDARGEPAELEHLPGRPVFRLVHPDGVAEVEDAIWLLSGPPDAALLDDLARAPLTAAQRARAVDCDAELSGPAAHLTPRAALVPGARYTLAVAAWARSQHGARLSADGTPLVFALRAAEGAELGARPLGSWPADGASGVGTNLEAVVIAFDGVVHGAAAGIWLEGPDGLAVPAATEMGPCAQIAPPHAGSFCVRLSPVARLAPAAEHRIAIGAAARDGRGAPVGPWQAAFRTAHGRDVRPPTALPSVCAVDERALDVGCALIDDTSIGLRVQADEAVVAALEIGAAVLGVAAPDGQVALHAAGLAPDTLHAMRVTLRDGAGNAIESRFELRTHPVLPALSIVEVLADPLGPEPQQEFIELLNHGASAVELLGFTLSDRTDAAGTEITSRVRIEPDARALLVADAFDPREGRDAAPLPGALLVRIGRSLASSGLRNAGEPLFLRDPMGRRVSAAPATPRPRPGVCIVRVGDDPRSGEPDAFDYAPGDSCTPGFSL